MRFFRFIRIGRHGGTVAAILHRFGYAVLPVLTGLLAPLTAFLIITQRVAMIVGLRLLQLSERTSDLIQRWRLASAGIAHGTAPENARLRPCRCLIRPDPALAPDETGAGGQQTHPRIIRRGANAFRYRLKEGPRGAEQIGRHRHRITPPFVQNRHVGDAPGGYRLRVIKRGFHRRCRHARDSFNSSLKSLCLTLGKNVVTPCPRSLKAVAA